MCKIPIQWRNVQKIYIPKVSTPSDTKLSDFRPITVSNVESKLFFSLISKRLETHLICNNKFINSSIQKGCMEKVPGCWEYLAMVWHVLKEARTQKSNLVQMRMGPSPSNRLFLLYVDMAFLHNGKGRLKITTKGYSVSHSESAASAGHRHQRGIFAGCTLSIILFLWLV